MTLLLQGRRFIHLVPHVDRGTWDTHCTRIAQVTVLNAVSAPLPFLPADAETRVSEEVRLRHRILDLRCAPGAATSFLGPSEDTAET